jgi:GT2 family glycosyltransferase
LEIPEKIHEHIDYPPGAAMWVSVKALSEVGVMDETFFLYGEEYEWSRRFKKAGFDIDYCANAFLKHKGSATISGNSSANSELSDFYWLRSRWLLARRNGVLSTTVFCLTSLIFPLRRALKQQWKRVHLYFWVMIHPESYYNDYKKLRP